MSGFNQVFLLKLVSPGILWKLENDRSYHHHVLVVKVERGAFSATLRGWN